MKKLLFLSLFLVVVFSSLVQAGSVRWVHEWTVDLYYANGVLADEQKLEKFDWKRRTKLLKQKYPSLKQALRFGDAKLAYNASFLWGLSDLTEVILQYRAEHPAAEITWQALSFFLKKKLKFDLGDLMERLGKITSEYTISEQMAAYKESVRYGHGVITIAHSQGNFFTNEVFKRIATMPKTSWMKPYLHMIGVAPPSKEVFGGGPHVLFDNDTIAILQAQSVTHHNPYRSQFRNAVNEVVDDFDVAFHSFAYYMGESVTYEDGFGSHTVSTSTARVDIEKYIMDALDAHLRAPSQWEKVKNLGCLCKQKRIIMKHKWDDELSKEFASIKIYEFDETGKLYHVLTTDLQGLTFARSSSRDGNEIEEVERDNICYILQDIDDNELGAIEGTKEENLTIPTGLFTAQLNWYKTQVHMELDGDLMSESVSGCGMAAAGSGDLTLDSVYPGTYGVNVVNVEGHEYLNDTNLSDTVTLKVKAVSANKQDRFTVTKKYQYPNLGKEGHVADIVITQPQDPASSPVTEVIPTSSNGSNDYDYGGYVDSSTPYIALGAGGGGNGSGGSTTTIPISHNNPPLCQSSDCACVPCEYKILTYLNQTRLGPISGADVILYKATEEGSENREILYSGKTGISSKIDEAGTLSLPIPYPQQTTYSQEELALMDAIKDYDGDFILEVSGGVDIDKDDDFNVDRTFTQMNGKLHLILSKEKLLQNDYKVNILTEIAYRLSKDLLGTHYDKARLQARLDDIAKRVLIEKLYPDATEPLGRDDLFYWVPMAHKNWLVKPYDTTLAPIVNKVYAGEDITEDAYRYVYGDAVSQIPILKSHWFQVDENATGGTLIGKIVPISEGNGTITHYSLSGEGSALFRIENDGSVYLEENASLDYESVKRYQMQLRASNSAGESRPVTLYITVNNIPDVPEDRSFSGGVVSEDATEGTVVGRMHFNEGAAPIERIEMGGADADDFTVDINGTIRVSDTANFDYERKNHADITLQAFNALGGSRVVPIHIVVTDAVDVPIVKMLDVHLEENATVGTVVGKMEILTDDPLTELSLNGDGADSFAIDINGTVRLAEPLDYERRANYVLQVVASNLQGASRPGTLIVRIDDMPDVPQLARTVLHVREYGEVGTIAGRIRIKSSGTSPIERFFLGGEGSEYFAVDANGTVTLASAQLSHDRIAYFNLYATATNAEGTSFKTPVVVYVDTRRPVLGILDTWVYENSEAGTVVGTVPVAENGKTITEMRLQGDGAENFTIDKKGVVRVAANATLDYERQTDFSLQVYARNEAGESKAAPLHIRVIDRPDTVTLQGFDTTIYEDTPTGSTIGFVRVLSTAGKEIVRYTLSGEGATDFTVAKDGSVRIADTASLSRDKQSRYHLRVTATDSEGAQSAPVYADIYVVDSIDTPPKLHPLTLHIAEDTPVQSIVGHIDIVSKTAAVERTWLTGEDNERFVLKRNGDIVLQKPLDYENKKSYTLQMYARNRPGTSRPATLTIDVINVPDDEPVLRDTNLSVAENTPVGTVVGTIEINSTGSSPIKEINLSGYGAYDFRVDTNGTVRTARTIDYERQKRYYLEATAANAKAPSDPVNVIIDVDNVPETVPVVYAFKGYVEENASAGTVIGKVQLASKGDSPVIGYELSGMRADDFNIDDNGTLSVSDTAQLNETTHKFYALRVRAKNSAGLSSYANVSIVVTYDKTIPEKPDNPKLLDIAHNSITLGWKDNAQNERGFRIYVDGVLNATVDANVTNYRVTGLSEETAYLFTIKAFNDRGESEGASIEGITDIDRTEYLKSVLERKCGISGSDFNRLFDPDTGYFNGSIYCGNVGLSDEDLLDFKALKGVRYGLYLNNNNLTNLDGLSNLKSVGDHLYLQDNSLTNVDGLAKLQSVGGHLQLENNRLTNVNGLSKLESVGRNFYLQNNRLNDIDGLSALQSVGNHLYLYGNRLTQVDGLSALQSVGGNFNLENNRLANLDGLHRLTRVGGYVDIYKNPNLTDISGIENVEGNPQKYFYIDPGQYETKANGDATMCSTSWDLRDANGDIPDDMNYVCEGQEPYVVSDTDRLKGILERKCGISGSDFNRLFDLPLISMKIPVCTTQVWIALTWK